MSSEIVSNMLKFDLCSFFKLKIYRYALALPTFSAALILNVFFSIGIFIEVL